MDNQKEYSPKDNFYEFYLIGAFLALALPLLIFPPWFTPLGWGKSIVFRSVFAVLFFIFLYQILNRKVNFTALKVKIKSISPLFWLLSALFGIYLIATIFSYDIKFSLWGNPARSGGFINFAFFIFFSLFLFLAIKKEDFRKLLNLAILIGILASIIAIFQQFEIYQKYIIPTSERPFSTIGNPILLAIYLLLISFLTLVLGIEAKNLKKKIFYFVSLALFLFVAIVLTQSRAAFFGLAIGLFWLIFAHPKSSKKFKVTALITLIIILVSLVSLKLYLDAHLDAYYKLMPRFLADPLDRTLSIFEGTKTIESRLSTWKVAFLAFKEKPLLGWGPENFISAFDKYYDPSLPIIGTTLPYYPEPIQWWDRAHNFILDTLIAAGLPALIIYLSFFILLFGFLQKAKTKDPENSLIHHGLQATFLAYLAANLASFDNFDIYVVLFFLLGYSFSLIAEAKLFPMSEHQEKIQTKIFQYKYLILIPLFLLLTWFIFIFNFKPLSITKETNLALASAEFKNCQSAIARVEKISSSSTIINNYLRGQWVIIIGACSDANTKPTITLIETALQLYRENVKEKPKLAMNWILLGRAINSLIQERHKLAQEGLPFSQEEIEKFKNEAYSAFERASVLTPKRQEVYKEWARTDILVEEYKMAKSKAQECIDLDPYGACYWVMALIHGYLKDETNFNFYLEKAKEQKFDSESQESLEELIDMYVKIGNFRGLEQTYSKLITLATDNAQKAQLLASLSFTYAQLGEFEKARETALKILEILPSAKNEVDTFLEGLPR